MIVEAAPKAGPGRCHGVEPSRRQDRARQAMARDAGRLVLGADFILYEVVTLTCAIASACDLTIVPCFCLLIFVVAKRPGGPGPGTTAFGPFRENKEHYSLSDSSS